MGAKGDMRVLHVVASGRRRGAEVFASDLVRVLNDAGVSQWVAVLRSGDIAVPFGASITSLSSNSRQVPVVRIDPTTLQGLRSLVSSWKPDVVQAHGGEPLKYSIAVKLGRGGPPVVYRRIGSAPDEIARGPRRAVYGGLMRRAARVIAVAEVLRREAVEMFRVPPERVVTIPNGVDPTRLRPAKGRENTRRELGIPSSAHVVLSLGALVWEKDPMAQLEIAARLAREDPEFVYLMAGDGPLRGEVEAAARRADLDGRIRLLGVRDDVADLLAATDVLLFASCSEGMAASVIEAGMAGVPVAAFSVGGIPEVVEDGVTGLLAERGDVAGLAARASRLLAESDLRADMGRAAAEVCSRFDIATIGKRYLAEYEGLVRAS